MNHAAIKKFCLGLPGATLSIQWGDDYVFKVGGKMFAVMGPPAMRPQSLAFKASSESFEILTQTKNIIPAPYLARAQWVRLERLSALKPAEIRAYLVRAHALVAAGLTRKKRAELGLG